MREADNYRTAGPLEARIAFHARFADPEKDTFLAAWRLYPFAAGMRVLEVGCGTGAFWKHEAGATLAPALDLVLTDRSAAMVARARELLESWPRVTLERANAAELPYDAGSFDAVVCNFVLPFVDDPDRVTAELARVVRPEGFLGAALPGRRHMTGLVAAGGIRVPEMFHAEQGNALFARHFEHVEAHALLDTMRVTEAEPAAAWLASVPWSEPEQVEVARREIAAVIARDGHFPVDRATGLFVCRRPRAVRSA